MSPAPTIRALVNRRGRVQRRTRSMCLIPTRQRRQNIIVCCTLNGERIPRGAGFRAPTTRKSSTTRTWPRRQASAHCSLSGERIPRYEVTIHQRRQTHHRRSICVGADNRTCVAVQHNRYRSTRFSAFSNRRRSESKQTPRANDADVAEVTIERALYFEWRASEYCGTTQRNEHHALLSFINVQRRSRAYAPTPIKISSKRERQTWL